MKLTRKIFLFSLLSLLSIGFILVRAKVVSADPCSDKSGQDKVNCYQDQVNLLSNQSKTLSNQIAQFDAQIKLTQLKISQTEDQITLLGGRINQLEGSLTSLSAAFSSRAVESYKMTRLGDPFFVLISSPNLTETISRFHYLQRIEAADQDLMTRLQTAQTTYEGQKATQEQLQAQLSQQKANLNKQKADKAALLAITKNDEKKYQMLLAQALAEQGAIKSAISSALELLKNGGGEPVAAGAVIGVMGNSGSPDCSTGTHLHFAVLKDGNVQDPAGYLKSISVGWDNKPDGQFSFTGSWDWPISSPSITQGFGMTYYARMGWYNGNIHDGIDMTGDATIRTPLAGRVIHGSTTCDSSRIAGVSTLKYVAVAHDGGIITVYLHIQ